MRLDSKSTESNANWSSVPAACQALSPRLGATGHLADCWQQGQLLGRGPRAVWSLPQMARVSDHFPFLPPPSLRISLASSQSLPSWFSQASTPLSLTGISSKNIFACLVSSWCLLLRRLRRTHHLILRQSWEVSATCTSERRKGKELAHPRPMCG